MNFQLTKSFIDAALRAAQGLPEDASEGMPIPEMDGYFIIQAGRIGNGERVITKLAAEDGTEYDVYVGNGVHEDA